MTYSSGGLIQATDYNGFVSTTAGANINATWGSATTGYGQGNLGTVAAAGTVTATQWATLVNTLTAMGAHQGTTLTSRSAPTAGQTITALAAVNTDITNCYTNRFNAASTGSQYTGWTGTASKTSATGSGSSSWTITFTDTITFASATAATTFFNSGGYIKIQFSKTSTGTLGDTEWNLFIGTKVATGVFLSSDATAKTISGLPASAQGTSKTGGSGTPATLATGIGFNQLTGTPVTIYQQNDSAYTYTTNYVRINASYSGTVITLTTTWFDAGDTTPFGSSRNISGGTATSGISFGTAPATVVTYYPPETTYLASQWGTPTVASTVA
jgi:hypothetical protein